MDILADHPLQRLHSFGFDVRARFFVEVADVDALREALAWARGRGIEVLLLGGGSNLVPSGDLDALVIRLALRGIEARERDGGVRLRASAGESWSDLVEHCLARGWYGLENLAGIPGTAGAAPVQNIGAYGVELCDRLVEVELLDRDTLEIVRRDARDCGFGYRDSAFKGRWRERYAVTAIWLQLALEPCCCLTHEGLCEELAMAGSGSAASPAQVAQAVLRLRQRKLPDPAALGNAGSFFHNPVVDRACFARLDAAHGGLIGFDEPDGRVKLAAAQLVERCGYKGLRRGPVGVHDRHALVLVHCGGGTPDALLALAAEIQAAVHQAFEVELQIEPRVV
ncbi:MAG: UDP-N-acetylmuramate dehydrogenase [Deltaproteobacteria bacterium]|nr:UDP-N-acetylmuramate dehydrogenase [Deltaproteobacteria bacterium]